MIEHMTDIKLSLFYIIIIIYTLSFKKIIISINDLIFLFDYQFIKCIAHADKMSNLQIKMEENLFWIKMLKVSMLLKALDKVT